MEDPITAAPQPAEQYRLPALLQDIRLLDLLELSGTTLEASRLVRLSQPSVSRRYRLLADDFGLVSNRRSTRGCCYGTTTTMRLLRLGCRTHRLGAGVARLAADVLLQPLLRPHPWLLPTPTRFRTVPSWLELVRQGVVDGALLSGLEFAAEGPPAVSGVELLRLGELPLGLVTAAAGARPRRSTVLVPSRAVAGGLHQALVQRGLGLRIVGNSCQSPSHWLQRLVRSGLAMPLPALAPADGWAALQRLPLPEPLLLPVWLVLPDGWRQQTVLVHTAEQLGADPALVRPEGT